MSNVSSKKTNNLLKTSKIILLLPLLFLSLAAWGQINPVNMRGGLNNITNNPIRNSSSNSNLPNNTPAQDTTSSASDEEISGIEYVEETPDSVLKESIYIFHYNPLTIKIISIEHPIISPTGAQFHDQLDAFNGNYYLTVSELGHQHYSIFPSFDATPGLIYKPNIFPGFYKTPQNIRFYQVKTPYELLAYHSSINNDYQLYFTHTQNINNHWNYSLDYHLINPDGNFVNSAATNHLLDLTTNYYSPDTRYQLYAGFIWQQMVLGENGGLSNPTLFLNKPNYSTNGIPMLFSNRMSYTRDITLFAHQVFNTVRTFEWYRPIKQNFIDTLVSYDTLRVRTFDTITNDSITHDSIIYIYSFKVYDSIVGYDTLQPHAPTTFNTGAFALDLQWDQQKYRCVDSTLYNQFSAQLYWTNDAYMDHRWRNPVKLYGGIRPQFSVLQLNPAQYSQSSIQQIAFYPFAKLEISPWPASELKVMAEAAPNLSEYNLDATLAFPFRDSIGNSSQNLTFHAVAKAYMPELIYFAECQHLSRPINTQLQAIGIRKIEADYKFRQLFDIHLSANHISHNIWFEERDFSGDGTGCIPIQSDQSALLLQARASLYLQLGSWFHYDMQQMVQWSSDQNQIRVPLSASKNSIYSDFSLFKNALHAQVGIDLRYHTQFYADGFDPLLGIFYRQDEIPVGNYLWADVFINLQIKRASIYAKAGHLNALIESPHHFILPNYPTKLFGFFFGLTWQFFD